MCTEIKYIINYTFNIKDNDIFSYLQLTRYFPCAFFFSQTNIVLFYSTVFLAVANSHKE